MENSEQRLNKYLALHLGVSRRQADILIEKRSVAVNGTIAHIGARVSFGDTVTVDGHPVDTSTELMYVAFNKPVGYVCSRKRQGENPTIYELLPQKYHSLKPVGRLDRDSSGIILLTNDGDFALNMTHPHFAKTKRYEVTLDSALQPLHQQMIGDFGIDLEDGRSRLGLERASEDRTEWIVTMHEGRNRQIRRTFATLGYTVITLHRTDFGNYSLAGLQPGEYTLVGRP